MLDRRAMLGGTGLLAFPAAAWASSDRRIINAMMTDEPAHLNYPLFNTRIMQEICGNIHESLLLFDWQFKPHPNLARAFEMSPDGLTYTFHLRTDVQWHDGVKFTARGRDVIGEAACRKLAGLVMKLDELASVQELTAATVKG